MYRFTIELAGIPAEIHCRYETNFEFFRDYYSGREPLLTVDPEDGDPEQMQTEFDRIDEEAGLPKHRRSEPFLENSIIHYLLAEKLTAYDVILMHGSALCMDGEAIIFTAKSGTGKSTHAGFWREVFGDRVWMINDDKPMLRVTDDGIWVYGTPWDGKHHLSRNASAPLKSIVWLTRSEVNYIEPLPLADAFGVIFGQVYRPSDPVMTRRFLKTVNKLLNMASFYKLGCSLSPESALTAYEGMNRSRL